MAKVPSCIYSHSKKVCIFYKKCLRHLDSCYMKLDEYRVEAVLLRAEFDKNKDIKDFRVAKDLLRKGEAELFSQEHYNPKKFATSPGGCAYERDPPAPDWILDYWDPMEKAQYPKYFATREQRKIEYEKFYEKEYGPPPKAPEHAH